MEIEFGKYCLHTHSFYCGHAIGQLADYCKAAVESKIDVLGFTEHCPVKENRWKKSRMDYKMMEIYLEDVEKQKNDFNNLKVLSGFECDYFKEYKNYLSELKERVDYLITGVHYLQTSKDTDFPLHHYTMGKKELFAYSKQYIDSIESGLFSFGAHPDLFAIKYLHFDEEAAAVSKDIIECAVEYDLPLEVNGNGLLKNKILVDGSYRSPYPIEDFWKIAENYPSLKVVASPDAHNPINIERFASDSIDFLSPFSINFRALYLSENKKNGENLKFI